MNEHRNSWYKVDAGASEAGPTIGGEQSPPFLSRWEMAMKELSIFCDESGDFGPTSNHSPDYLIGLVLHDQSKDIGPQIERFRGELQGHGFTAYAPIHTAPLIRREDRYAEIDGKTRRKLFDILFAFFRRCDVKLKVIDIDKRVFGSGEQLEERLSRELGGFIRENLEGLLSYDRVVVYYDKGQKEISRILKHIFCATLSGVEFRTVSPADYLLFQVADLACTMMLVEDARTSKGMSRSEQRFFGGAASFKKTYYKAFEKKLI